MYNSWLVKHEKINTGKTLVISNINFLYFVSLNNFTSLTSITGRSDVQCFLFISEGHFNINYNSIQSFKLSWQNNCLSPPDSISTILKQYKYDEFHHYLKIFCIYFDFIYMIIVQFLFIQIKNWLNLVMELY